MNAHALLSAQGWRGTGHSLHKTDDSIGLAKPLLLSRKDNTKGLGQKQHFTSDQWWMNAFDEQLKGLDTTKEGKVVQTITSGKLNGLEKGKMGKWSVYATFVRGGFLEGTIGRLLDTDTTTTESESDGDEDDDAPPTMVARQEEEAGTEDRKETKEERRARKEAKRQRKEERAKARAARRERKANKVKKSSKDSSDSKEEKRARRARKEQKRKERLKSKE